MSMQESVVEDIKPVGQIVMLCLGIVVGIIAGFGGVVFRGMIALVHNLAFLRQWSWTYDANIHTAASPWLWCVIFIPVVGAVIVAWLVQTFASEAKGHGVPEVMYAIHYKQGIIRPIVVIIKSIASAISIGTGGSVGREGPIIQIGATFGSVLGCFVKMPARQRLILIAAGAGSGIAATFNAPLAGLMFAMELMLVTVNARSILPVAIATATATNIGRFFFGSAPVFSIETLATPAHAGASALQLLMYLPFGILMGLLSLVFMRSIYWFEDLFDAIPGNYYLRHMLGMLIVGVIMYLFLIYSGHYYIEGIGYATMINILSNTLLNPWFLILLFIAKYLATCLTLGSGASGGVFSPSLYLGATAGYVFGLLIHLIAPGLQIPPVAFAVTGMAAMVGGSTGAIFTSIIIVFEMTADIKLAVPMIISVSIACAVRRYFSIASIYTLKILRRNQILPDGLQASIIGAQSAKFLMKKEFKILDVAQMGKSSASLAVFVQDQQVVAIEYHGVIQRNYAIVSLNDSAVEVLRLMLRKNTPVILVFDNVNDTSSDSLRGIITEDDLVKANMNNAILMEV